MNLIRLFTTLLAACPCSVFCQPQPAVTNPINMTIVPVSTPVRNPDIQQLIKTRVEHYRPLALEWMRHFGEHPETSWEEFATTDFIEQQLDRFGIAHHRLTGVPTGTVAVIEGNDPDARTVFLRGDIDALNIDQTHCAIPIKSRVPGRGHCCGHHLHAATALCCAVILNELRSEFRGRVVVIFQPAEETIRPISGAQAMLKTGELLAYPNIAGLFGLHATPTYPTGTVYLREGGFMASVSEAKITVYGKTGHVAQPHNTVNPIPPAAAIVGALSLINTELADPVMPTLVSVTRFHSFEKPGINSNVISDSVEMVCVFRTFDEGWRQKIREKIREISAQTAALYGASARVDITEGIPPVFNNPALTRWSRSQLEAFLGKENIREAELRTGGDDVSEFLLRIPGVYLRLGTGNPAKGTDVELHQPNFAVDEDALPVGIGALSWLAYSALMAQD